MTAGTTLDFSDSCFRCYCNEGNGNAFYADCHRDLSPFFWIKDNHHRRNQIMVRCGKGARDRLVYLYDDAAEALAAYLQLRPETEEPRIFLVEKGIYKGKPLSVRGIQKRAEYYSVKSGVHVSCHQLRHTMATDLLNAGADIVIIQYLLGHSKIKTTMRYARLSNQKARMYYYQAMTRIMEVKGSLTSWNMRC